ncbi:hypothetical protein EKO04_008680 [Ascochyta lentis]|uniref:Uncharacterized protein n=1 Tax=Ascochyta lentis TaxID=205686 RepID=A0A8H7IW38_9PLEO|nr:hypothetical protein EKO04_008680 [Ascochyta lentis]
MHNRKDTMLKKVGSLAKACGSMQSTYRNLIQGPISRRTHTSSDSSAKATSDKEAKDTGGSVKVSDPLPQHDESHAGPYGVETPLDWDFLVTVTEVTVVVEMDNDNASCQKPAKNGNASAGVHGEAEQERI